jgi:hypothetical protein
VRGKLNNFYTGDMVKTAEKTPKRNQKDINENALEALGIKGSNKFLKGS